MYFLFLQEEEKVLKMNDKEKQERKRWRIQF